ncbi:anti-sigma factor [Georgenia yuyongxinii]|uniref:Anti-sigma factor n=1 Tax=Georgenia yuyongxinii TaxID=2589797 RepID=A0A552WRU5_9MICO|nr:anti-sigma factor [Georgenia yuyongxinii]TRW45474.1 anti-sigma factor [Georgenia yuyongxinii]
MTHPDEEVLALMALGEEVGGPEVRDHVSTCAHCSAELASLRRVTHAGRSGATTLERPSDAVWTRIAAELGLPDADSAAPAGPSPVAAAPAEPSPVAAAPAEPSPVAAAPAQPSPVAPAEPPPVAPAPSRWRRRVVWVAAASFLAGIAGTLLVQNLGPDAPSGQVLASAQLQPLPGWQAEGEASVRGVDGRRVLTVDLADVAGEGFREVWLIDTDLQRLVSLGVLAGSEGEFEVPAGLDLAEFAIVDVSEEPMDGDPAHSGDSIVRGELA